MVFKVLSDQGTGDDLDLNALEIKIASGKSGLPCLNFASKIAILNVDGWR